MQARRQERTRSTSVLRAHQENVKFVRQNTTESIRRDWEAAQGAALQEVQIQLHHAQSSTGAAHGDAQFSKVYLETQAALDANRWSSAYSSARLREIVRRQMQCFVAVR